MKLRNEDLKEIAKLIDKGESVGYIARRYNYKRQAMQELILRYQKHGLEGILHGESKKFTINEKIAIINRYYQGESMRSLAIEINVTTGLVFHWISKYEKLGYNGLIDNRGKPGV